MTMDQITYLCVMLKNDFHYIHLHAAGPDFDKIHSIAGDLYEELQQEEDELAELAISNSCPIDNFNNIISAYTQESKELLQKEAFSFEDLVEYIDTNGREYLDALKSVECDDETQDYIDEIRLFWKKQVDYFNAARKIPVNIEDTEQESDTPSDYWSEKDYTTGGYFDKLELTEQEPDEEDNDDNDSDELEDEQIEETSEEENEEDDEDDDE